MHPHFLVFQGTSFLRNAFSDKRLPTWDDLGTLKDVSKAIQKSLAANGKEVSCCHMLEAVASAVGSRNWKQYKANLVPLPLLEQMLRQAAAVHAGADSTGCQDDLTVTYESSINSMDKTRSEIQDIINDAKA